MIQKIYQLYGDAATAERRKQGAQTADQAAHTIKRDTATIRREEEMKLRHRIIDHFALTYD